jgi:hypothetical protein
VIHLIDEKSNCKDEQASPGNHKRGPQDITFSVPTGSGNTQTFLSASDANDDKNDTAQRGDNFVKDSVHSNGVLDCMKLIN